MCTSVLKDNSFKITFYTAVKSFTNGLSKLSQVELLVCAIGGSLRDTSLLLVFHKFFDLKSFP